MQKYLIVYIKRTNETFITSRDMDDRWTWKEVTDEYSSEAIIQGIYNSWDEANDACWKLRGESRPINSQSGWRTGM